MDRQFHNKRQLLTVTNKQAGVDKLFDRSKNFTGYMFHIKLEKKLYKMSFKDLLVKIQRSKNRQGEGHNVLHTREQIGLKTTSELLI